MLVTFMQIVMVPNHNDALKPEFVVVCDGNMYKVPPQDFVRLQVGMYTEEKEIPEQWRMVEFQGRCAYL